MIYGCNHKIFRKIAVAAIKYVRTIEGYSYV